MDKSSGHVQHGGDTGVNPELAGGMKYLIWSGKASGGAGKRDGITCSASATRLRMNG